MKHGRNYLLVVIALLALAGSITLAAPFQDRATVLTGAELTRMLPTGFYFQGQSAPTQMRNGAAARLGKDRYVIAGLVDTAGYSAEIRARYEGFLITDSAITVNGQSLPIGAYGFGFSNDGKMTVFDLAGNQVLSVSSTNDKALRRPRPLMMTAEDQGVRLYSRRDYVVISPS
jgi:hypothetical protein